MRVVSAVSFLVLFLASPALAADLPETSLPSAVTVYPDGASVTRLVDFDVPAGDTTLVLRDFPLGLDPSSLRLSGSGGGGVTIGSVDARIVYVTPAGSDAALEARIREAQDRRAAVEASSQAAQVKKAFIERVANSIDLAGSGAEKRSLDPAALSATFDLVGTGLAAVNEAIRLDGIRLRDIDEELARLEAERQGRAQGKQAMEVRVSLAAPTAAKGTLSLVYLISGARWNALYDARLDTSSGELEIIRRAEITQQTGEDWSEVDLTVSTARATSGAAAPYLSSTLVSFESEEKRLDNSQLLAPRRNKLAAEPETDAMEAPAAAPAVAMADKPLQEAQATLDTGGFQSVWLTPGKTTILSGPSSRAIRLASMTLKPDVVARSVPSLDTTAYLEAVFNHDEDTPLFPGNVSIYRDGLYAGIAPMALSTRGEKVRLGFGADDRIKVERIALKREQSDSGIVSTTRNDRQEFVIKVRNGRTGVAKVSIEEALPVSEDAEITVAPIASMTKPTLTDADDRRGVLVWTQDIAAGESTEIQFGYTISWPAGKQIAQHN